MRIICTVYNFHGYCTMADHVLLVRFRCLEEMNEASHHPLFFLKVVWVRWLYWLVCLVLD